MAKAATRRQNDVMNRLLRIAALLFLGLVGLGSALLFGSLILAQLPGRDNPTTTQANANTPLRTITIHQEGQQQMVRTRAQTVSAALQQAGITLAVTDQVEPDPSSPLDDGLHIYIRRAIPLLIKVDGRLMEIASPHRQVADVLAGAGINLVGDDFTRPGPDTLLQPNDIIEVIRVTENFLIEDQPIPYETLWQPSDSLELDTEGLLQAGVPGILRRRVRVRYHDGTEASRTATEEWVAREPTAEIMGYGTRIVLRTLQTPGGSYQYWRVARMRVTSYTAASSGKPPDHPAYGITASGLQAGTGIVAIDRSVIPFRSWVYVPGYGIGYAGDTGGGVIGRWIDLGYDETEFVPWSGYVDVYYLVPMPENINYRLPQELP